MDGSIEIDAEITDKLASGEIKHLKNFDPDGPNSKSEPSRQPPKQRFHNLLQVLRTRYGVDHVHISGPLDLETGQVSQRDGQSLQVGIFVSAKAYDIVHQPDN